MLPWGLAREVRGRKEEVPVAVVMEGVLEEARSRREELGERKQCNLEVQAQEGQVEEAFSRLGREVESLTSKYQVLPPSSPHLMRPGRAAALAAPSPLAAQREARGGGCLRGGGQAGGLLGRLQDCGHHGDQVRHH